MLEKQARDMEAISWEEAAAFFGPNAETFRKAWEGAREGAMTRKPRDAWSWSWPAFLLFPAWFCYRRMWAGGAVFMGAVVAMVLLGLSSGALGMAIVFGFYSRSFYVQDVVERITKLRETGPVATDQIAAAGGTSRLGGAIAAAWVALVAAYIIINIIVGIAIIRAG